MTRTPRLATYIGFLITIASLLYSGCGKSSSSTGNTGSTGTITVLIVDETGKPVSGGEVFTEPASQTVSVGENGQAVLEGIPIKQYNVKYIRDDIPEFGKFVRLDESPEQTVQLVIVSALTVTVKDEQNRPVQSTIVTTFPETEQVETDSEGQAVIHNIPLRQYSFKFERPNLPVVTRSIIINTENIYDFAFTLESESPVPEIISPQDNEVFGPYSLTFEGRGSDYEDGDIPENRLSWTSNLDGELGSGKSLIVAALSQGNHVIRLTAEDSDGKSESTTISVVIVDYNPDSFFPLLENISWSYRFQTPVFSVINENNVTEVWNMGSMDVKLNDEMNRTITIIYTITRGSIIEKYRYTLTDILEEEDGTVFITGTDESLSISRPGSEGSPFFRFNSETTYDPRYTLLKNVTEPDVEEKYDIEVMAQTSITYFQDNTSIGPNSQSLYLPVTFTFQGNTVVQTDQGSLQALKMQIITDTETPTVRHLWLTRGIGIVKMDFDTFGDTQTVVLSESNILKYYRAQKASSDNYYSTPAVTPTYYMNVDYRTNLLDHLRFVRSFIH